MINGGDILFYTHTHTSHDRNFPEINFLQRLSICIFSLTLSLHSLDYCMLFSMSMFWRTPAHSLAAARDIWRTYSSALVRSLLLLAISSVASIHSCRHIIETHVLSVISINPIGETATVHLVRSWCWAQTLTHLNSSILQGINKHTLCRSLNLTCSVSRLSSLKWLTISVPL